MNTGTGALIVGSTLAAIQAASDLADSGIPVTLVEQSPFLGGPSLPQMLNLVKHPNVTLLTDANVITCTSSTIMEPGSRVEITRRARYIDLEKCTACGDCAVVCPMPLETAEGEHCAVFKPHPQAVPNVFAIEKEGTAPCRNACPIDQRAQGYIALIREGRFAEAYLTIKQENPFPSICGRVCNHRCESACNRAQVDGPLNVMGLKRFVADWAAEHPEEIAQVTPKVRPEPKGKRVAVVGGGPAGLTCALDMVRMGYQATVFEAQPVAGGMMRLGVPDHRLPPEVVQREIDEIAAAGVEIKLNHRVDDMGSLLEQNYDAVFIAIGAHMGAQLPIQGIDLPDVYLATDFLRDANLGEPVDVKGQRVLVIGGGNVGLDVAQVSVRHGASWVGMSCLESREQMPAFEWEIQDAEEEGVQIYPNRSFKEITGAGYVDGEWVTGVRCVEVDFRGFVDGRPDMDEIPGTEQNISADVVVFAVGQWPDLTGVPDELERVRGRWLLADEKTQVTNIDGVTAGGDVVTGTSFIVDAIAAGHKAAHALDTYLATGAPAGWQATNPSQQVVEFTHEQASAKLQDRHARYAAKLPRHDLPQLPAEERVKSFVEMYGGLTQEEAVAEAKRCLVCGACSECLACVRVCQAGAIDHYDQPQAITLNVGTILWADPQPQAFADHGYALPNDDLPAAAAVVARAMADLVYHRRRTHLAPSVPAEKEATRVGLFVCRCGGKISEVLDVEALVEAAGSLPGVAYAQALDFSCQPETVELVKEAMSEYDFNRVTLAACSCCSLDQACDSCTYQRVRCKNNLLGAPFELANLPTEFVNIREQCAWAHRDNPRLAMIKAERLMAAAVVKASLLPRVPRPSLEIDPRVLVAGAGKAAGVCANALRMQSLAVAQCEEIPLSIDGSLGGFTVTLAGDDWGWQVDASVVVLAPADEEQIAHLTCPVGVFFCAPNGDAAIVGGAVATKVGATCGSGRILADHNVARVDSLRCVGCGACESVCEYHAVRLIEVADPAKRDPVKEFVAMMEPATADAGPTMAAQVNPAICLGCGTCAAHCPSSAIAAGYSTDKQIEAMLAAMLAQ